MLDFDKYIKTNDTISKITDKSLMPVGKHKGLPMETVPADYLVYIFDEKFTWVPGNVRTYIETNYDILQKELKQQRRK